MATPVDAGRAAADVTRGPTRLLVGGDWVPARSERTFTTLDPATGAAIAEVAEGAAEDVELAVAAARRAFEGPWSRFTPAQRQRAMYRLVELAQDASEELARLDTLDMGAPLVRSRGAVASGLARLAWCASQATAIRGDTIDSSLPGEYFTYTVKEPVGVVGAIIPWNAPVASTMWKLGPVLATGCTMVLKPAEEAVLSALRIAELCLEAGIPEGVVNVVTGFGAAGAALAEHPDVDKIAFTGSLGTAQKIIQASAGNLKRLSLELGGKSPNIVFADADVEEAVAGAVGGVFANSGQICSAGSRIFVQRPVYDEFVDLLAQRGAALRVGNGFDPDTEIGPLVSQAQLDRVLGYLDRGRAEGAAVRSGGTRVDTAGLGDGYFVAPTVFADARDDMAIAREEIFGPVASMLVFDDLDEVGRRANATPFGLAAGVWTRDVGKAHALAKSIRAGTVWVNCYQVMDAAMPFGGYKMSGYGREGGVEHLDAYLEVKGVYLKLD